MAKQPLKAVHKLRKAKTMLVLPEQRSPHQFWLLVQQHPSDNRPGSFFITHAMNFDKFDNRPGFTVLAHSFDKEAIRNEACHLNMKSYGHTSGGRLNPIIELTPTKLPELTESEAAFGAEAALPSSEDDDQTPVGPRHSNPDGLV